MIFMHRRIDRSTKARIRFYGQSISGIPRSKRLSRMSTLGLGFRVLYRLPKRQSKQLNEEQCSPYLSVMYGAKSKRQIFFLKRSPIFFLIRKFFPKSNRTTSFSEIQRRYGAEGYTCGEERCSLTKSELLKLSISGDTTGECGPGNLYFGQATAEDLTSPKILETSIVEDSTIFTIRKSLELSRINSGDIALGSSHVYTDSVVLQNI